MNQSDLDEQRFQTWLDRLEKCLQDDAAAGSSSSWSLSSTDKAALLETIKTTAIFDKESVPAWAIRNERVLSCLSSTSEELKSRLRRLSLPKLYNYFDQLKPKNELKASLTKVAIRPMKREKNFDYEIIHDFFENLDKNPTDVVVGMCKLADYGNRFAYIKEADESYLTKLVQYETRRHQTSEQELIIRNENLKYLERSDEENLVSTSLVNFREHLGQLRSNLQTAEEEEEIARKNYEAAMMKVKKSKESVEKFETFIDVVGTQSDVLAKVNTIKIQLDKFNNASSANRLNMLGSLQNVFMSVQTRLMDQRMKEEYPVLLQNLSEIFRTMIASIDYKNSDQPNSELTTELSDQPVSTYCAVRIGLETINLWRRLMTTPIDPVIDLQLHEFMEYLQHVAKRLPDSPFEGLNSSQQFVDTTVVLYYNHIHHETPANHIENQLRTDSCMKLLLKKVNSQMRQHSLLGSSSSSAAGSGGNVNNRHLVVEKCNDVLSPPLWCLPLVHGPQYLTQLWKYSEEAADEDLYVPLEFETEWETDDEGLDEDVDEKILLDSLWKKRRNANCATLSSNMEVDELAKEKLGREKTQKLENILTPRFGDFLIARALKKNVNSQHRSNQLQSSDMVSNRDRGSPSRISRRFLKTEKMESDVSSDESVVQDDIQLSRPLKPSKAGMRVRTPFGGGTLIDPLDSDEDQKSEKIVRVRLDWGAMGYLNTKVLHRSRRMRSIQPGQPAKKRQKSNLTANGATDIDRSNKDRFLYTNFTVHRIVRRILAQVKVQRLILDRFGVKDAHLSLWIHGRTSRGITQNIENGILDWLSKYDKAQLEQFLDEIENTPPNESLKNDIEIGTHFIKALDAVRQSDMSRPDNLVNYRQDPSESREALIEEGFAYSAKRLIKKSGEMRAKTVKTKRKSKFGDSVKSSGHSATPSISTVIGTNSGQAPVHRLLQFATSTGNGHSSTAAPTVTSPSPRPRNTWKPRSPRGKEDPILSSTDADKLRMIFQKLNSMMNISQTWFANELNRRYGIKTSQTTISAWTRNKASNVSSRLLDTCVLKWVDHHKRLLSQVLLTEWDQLAARYKAVIELPDAVGQSEGLIGVKVEDSNDRESQVSNVMDIEEEDDDMKENYSGEQDGLDQPKDGEEVPMEEAEAEGDEDAQEEVEDDVAVEEEEDGEICSETEQVDIVSETPVEKASQSDALSQAMDIVSSAESADEQPAPVKQESSSDELVSESEQESDADDVNVSFQGNGNVEENSETFEILTKDLKRLWKDFTAEQNRRGLTHSYISQEGTRLGLKLPQPSISKFCREKVFPFVNRAREFLNHLTRWMAYSATKSAVDSEDDQSSNVCSGCGTHRMEFSNQKDFLSHIGSCSAKHDIVPLEAKIDKYSHNGPLLLFEYAHERASIEESVQKFSENPLVALQKKTVRGGDICVTCGKGNSMKLCSACLRSYHPACVSESRGDTEWCAECKQQIRGNHYRVPANNIHVGLFVLAFNDERGVWQEAVVAHKLKENASNHDVVLLKFLHPLIELSGNDRNDSDSNRYQWQDLSSDCIFIIKIDSENTWRRRSRKSSTPAPTPSRKRSSQEIRDGVDAEEDDDGELPKRTRPRRIVEEPVSDRVGRRSTTGRGGRGQQQQHEEQHQDSKPTNAQQQSKSSEPTSEEIMTDTYLSANSLKAALCAAGSACRAVDIVMTNRGSNVFVCTRPPGHHAGRYGLTRGCLGTGFCLLNNAAIALTYARVRWGLERIAIVDIDVHFGNGTADILKGDKDAFFASVHMIYGQKNDGILTPAGGNSIGAGKVGRNDCVCGFYPSKLGATSISDNFISVGVFPQHLDQIKNHRRRRRKGRVTTEDEDEDDDEFFDSIDALRSEVPQALVGNSSENYVGAAGFVRALKEVVIPRMERYQPQLLVISAGFDGYSSDPLGGEMGLSLEDFTYCTNMLTSSMSHIAKASGDPRSGRVISLLEGGYDTSVESQGLAKCVDAHVTALRTKI